jgi:hypothetical protein
MQLVSSLRAFNSPGRKAPQGQGSIGESRKLQFDPRPSGAFRPGLLNALHPNSKTQLPRNHLTEKKIITRYAMKIAMPSPTSVVATNDCFDGADRFLGDS